MEDETRHMAHPSIDRQWPEIALRLNPALTISVRCLAALMDVSTQILASLDLNRKLTASLNLVHC